MSRIEWTTDATCPNCGAQGPGGAPCETDGCAVQELHFVPTEFVQHCFPDPLGRDPLIGRMVDDYLVARKIGSGGFGAVYVALQMPLFMKTALKMLKIDLGQDASAHDQQMRFETEAQALARLAHPNIVRLIKYGMFNGIPYIVMEHVGSGLDLAQELAERKRAKRPFNLSECQHIATQMLHALEAAHNHNVIHRDIKPANIILQPVEGDPLFVRVLDFGLAKMVSETPDVTIAGGTPVYMAPEQYFGRDMGPWTDLYATSLVCFELMTGRKAFAAANSQELYAKKTSPAFDIARETDGRPLPAAMAQFMRKATATEPIGRFRTVPEFLTAARTMFNSLAAAGVTSLHPGFPEATEETLLAASETVEPGITHQQADEQTATSSSLPSSEDDSRDRSVPAGPKRSSKLRLLLLLLATAVALSAATILLWAIETVEVRLSNSSEGDQETPALAVLSDGRVIAAWVARRSDGTTGDVFARVFSATGSPAGDEFKVSSFDDSDLRMPVCAAFSDGRVLTLWNSEGQDGSGMGVIGQWLTPDLTRHHAEFVVNSDFRQGNQEWANIAVAEDDRFAVVWQSSGQDGDDSGIVAQFFAADGSREGSSFVVNTLTVGRQRFAAVATGPARRFLVVWESSHASPQGEEYTVYGQLLDAQGERIGNEFTVNTFTEGRQRYPDVVSLPKGYAVVWTSENQDGSRRAVFGQLFDQDAARVGEEFQVNSFTAGDQWLPKAAAFPDGRFVVLWVSGGQDGAGLGAFGQVFASDAARYGSEFQVNVHTDSDQIIRSVAVLGEDRLAAAWDSRGQDGSGWGVFARFWSLDRAIRDVQRSSEVAAERKSRYFFTPEMGL
jgi:serine/threonine protein kinase